MFTTIGPVDEEIHNSSIRNELITVPITLSDRRCTSGVLDEAWANIQALSFFSHLLGRWWIEI
jgi:hypothetical protein